MRNRCIALTALIVWSLPVFAQGGTSQTAPNAADEAAIRALVAKCIEGWNRGSGEAFAAQFAEDSDYVVVNGMHLEGRQENAANHQRIFDTFYKGTRVWAEVKSIRFLRPDVAVMHSVSTILKPGESPASPQPGAIQTWVVSRHGEEWLIDAFQNTPIAPPTPPPAQPGS
ncbi:MAG TPA: SgcJ/EcaC family oxidoreductase [Thermoanaerobaculia bacterium]|nr:SgcJ/EcaC family oxidoreductase [Thermoanaerobaculia bacterium]